MLSILLKPIKISFSFVISFFKSLLKSAIIALSNPSHPYEQKTKRQEMVEKMLQLTNPSTTHKHKIFFYSQRE